MHSGGRILRPFHDIQKGIDDFTDIHTAKTTATEAGQDDPEGFDYCKHNFEG
jgi:hypothetical protein